MSYWVYVTLSCHNWKRNDFHYSGAYLFTSFVYCTNGYWSVIHGIKSKPHLSVVWNWYHFVAIAILHQPRPTDSAEINTRLQLSDTSSIPPMHGGFLLVLAQVMPCYLMELIYHLNLYWIILSEVLWHSHYGNFTENGQDMRHWYEFENYSFKHRHLPGIMSRYNHERQKHDSLGLLDDNAHTHMDFFTCVSYREHIRGLSIYQYPCDSRKYYAICQMCIVKLN